MSGQGGPTSAGWYEQAGNPGVLRYFDGRWWSTRSRPKTAEFPGIPLGSLAAAAPQPPADDQYASSSQGAPAGGRFAASGGDPFAPPTTALRAPAGPAPSSGPFASPGFAPPAGPPRATAGYSPSATAATNPFAPPLSGVPMPVGPAAAVDSASPFGTWGSAPPAPAWRPGAPFDPPSDGWGQNAWSADPWQQPRRPAPAHWGWRVLGCVIDYLVVAVPVWALTFVAGMVYAATRTGRGGPVDQGFALEWEAVMYGLGGIIQFVNRSVYGGRTGRSLGRLATGTRLVSADTGRPLGVWLAFVRDVAHLLDNITFGLGYLWPLWDPRRQTFADKAVSSVVVR